MNMGTPGTDPRRAKRPRVRRGGIAALLAAPLLLSGCGDDPDPAPPSCGPWIEMGGAPYLPPVRRVPASAVLELRGSATVSGSEDRVREAALPAVRVTLSFDAPAGWDEDAPPAPIPDRSAGHPDEVRFAIASVELLDPGSDEDRGGALRDALARQDVTFVRGVLVDPHTPYAVCTLTAPAAAAPPVAELLRRIELALTAFTLPLPLLGTPEDGVPAGEGLGVGSEWEVGSSTMLAGLHWTRWVHGVVRTADPAGDGAAPQVVVEVTTRLEAGPQPWEAPADAAGGRAELVEGRGSARGEWRGPPGAVLPTDATLDLVLEPRLRVHHGGETIEVVSRQQLQLRLTSRGPE